MMILMEVSKRCLQGEEQMIRNEGVGMKIWIMSTSRLEEAGKEVIVARKLIKLLSSILASIQVHVSL